MLQKWNGYVKWGILFIIAVILAKTGNWFITLGHSSSASSVKESFDKPYSHLYPEIKASNWIVIYTVSHPSETPYIEDLVTTLDDWHVLVVGDFHTPTVWHYVNYSDSITFLDINMQQNLPYAILDYIPFNSPARKNIGYLFAIEHGADLIFETSDQHLTRLPDVLLGEHFSESSKMESILMYNRSGELAVNPYAHFGQPTVWPRGFPLSKISSSVTMEMNTFQTATSITTPIQNALTEGDPDLDAVFRLTRKGLNRAIDIHFDADADPVALPRGLFAPYGGQSTMYHKAGFWALLLPTAFSTRVMEIWRSYWTQRLLWEMNAYMTFFPPYVRQDLGNSENYFSDFQEEVAIYTETLPYLESLLGWTCSSSSPAQGESNFFLCMRELTEKLVQDNFWAPQDVDLVKAWLADLGKIGYAEPLPKSKEIELESSSRVIHAKSLSAIYLGQELKPDVDQEIAAKDNQIAQLRAHLDNLKNQNQGLMEKKDRLTMGDASFHP